MLLPGEQHCRGEVVGSGLVGIGVDCLDDLPRDRPRTEEIYAVITAGPVDLAVLETEQTPDLSMADRGDESSLPGLCAQLRDGGAGHLGDQPDDFVIRRLEMLVAPIDAALARRDHSI